MEEEPKRVAMLSSVSPALREREHARERESESESDFGLALVWSFIHEWQGS